MADPNVAALLAALTGQTRPQSQPPLPQNGPPNQQMSAASSLSVLQGLLAQQQQQQHQPGPLHATPYSLPQPTNSGSLDLSNIKPSSSGTVSLQDAIARAKNFASERGVQPGSYRSPDPHRDMGGSYGGREPPQAYPSAYRDERRGRNAYNDSPQQRDRSFSPPRRGARSPPRGYRDRTPPNDGNVTETMMIEAGLVGLIIGRKGETLKRVEEISGARVQFVTDNSNGPERICNITGPRMAVQSAKTQISTIISENSAMSIIRGDDRGGSAGPPGAKKLVAAAPGYGQQPPSAHHPILKEGEDSSQIMVPDRTVGLIIGRRGETIQDLQEKSGCHINIVGETKSVNGLRPVNLIGTPEAAARARTLIMEIVSSDVRPGGGGGGGGPPPPKMGGGTNSNFTPVGGQGGYGGGGGGGGGGAAGGYGGPNERGEKQTETIRVPLEAVGMIIGKGGETIKEMQSSTGCRINVSSQAHPSDPEREISLQGSPDAIYRARQAIEEKVDEAQRKGNNRGRDDGGRGGRGGGDHYGSNGGDRGGYPQQQQQQQQSYQPQQSYAPPSQQAGGLPMGGAPAAADGAADPYAAYGGYQQYAQMYYAAILQQQQAAAAAGQGQGEPRPPGT